MKLLKDDELYGWVTGQTPIITGHNYTEDWYAKRSPIQPSSIDLTIGNIFLPGAKRDEAGGETAPLPGHNLRPGQTAILTTREQINLPANLAAIGFPPSSVSSKGILMTNPGHIDPGFSGHLDFTIINMGSQEYPLERGAAIVTVLVFELSGAAHRDWHERTNTAGGITQRQIDILSADFLDVTRRAKDIAHNAVTKATFRATLISVIVPALLVALPTLFMPPWGRQLETDVKVMKESLSVDKANTRLTKLEEEMQKIKAATCQQTPLPRYCDPATTRAPAAPRKTP
jgi:deoxycytidine triphosphate deaminase